MKPRRILIFSLAYFPRFVGGAEVAVKEITDRIAPGDIEFDMVTLGDGRGLAFEKIGKVNVHRVFKKAGLIQKLLFPLSAFKKAGELDSADHYDLLWPIMASYAGWAAWLFKKLNRRVPLVLTVQEGENFRRRSLFRFVFSPIFASADRIQVISGFLAEWSAKMGGKCPITVIPNGVDFDLFSRKIPIERASGLKKSLGKKEDDIFLVTTSRLARKNAVSDLIKALTYLPANVKLLVIGSGPLTSGLLALTARLKLDDRVRFLGFVPHENLPAYLQVSDIFVRPSLSEGLGNSFLEAMAAGLPVIATPVGGIPDFLKDGETGLFCEVGNPLSIAQKVEKLIKDGESRNHIVEQAAKMVREKYDWDMIADRMKSLLMVYNMKK